MRIVITGANGYIGTTLANYAIKQEHHVYAASRTCPIDLSLPWLAFDLANPTLMSLPENIDAVIHLAANTHPTEMLLPEQEIEAAKLLLEKTRQQNARFIFISSQAAAEDAPTAYGKTKWQIERHVLTNGGWVVRPGQVYGGKELGLFGQLVTWVKNMPILPAFIPSPCIQPIHVEELSQALLRIAASQAPAHLVYLGSATPLSFSRFLRAIAHGRLKKRAFFIPIPRLAIYLAYVLLGSNRSERFGITRLRSLFALQPMDTTQDLKEWHVTPIPIESGMRRKNYNYRRALIAEAYGLLSYVGNVRPRLSIIRRYVDAIAALRHGECLNIPDAFLRYPWMLTALDTPHGNAELRWRIELATMLYETTSQPASFKKGYMRAGAGILHATSGEALSRISSKMIRFYAGRI